jgi:hypothetical protein
MRLALSLSVLALVTTASLVEACSGEGDATQIEADAGGPAPGPTATTSSSSGGSSTSSSSSSSSSSSGGPDAGSDAGDGGGKSVMTFFASSVSGGNGGDLGGLTGADAKCQSLAAAAGGGDHTWRAYLSTTGQGAVNAKDRIGAGPWRNKAGTLIANTTADLHAAAFNLPQASILDEKGAAVPTNRHDILTGSTQAGVAVANANCQNWTNNGGGNNAAVGHTDSDQTAANAADRWNNAHNVACNAQAMIAANGEGRIYCFATD